MPLASVKTRRSLGSVGAGQPLSDRKGHLSGDQCDSHPEFSAAANFLPLTLQTIHTYALISPTPGAFTS